jgi:signal transduction histidine kinase/ligand-binding sensor domain-containing protein
MVPIAMDVTSIHSPSTWQGILRSAAACTLLSAGLFRPALSLQQPLKEMDHAMWTARDGAPQGVLALAQAKDGTLWIGSEAGLFNFEGRSFTAFVSPPGEPPLPTAPVYSVFVDRDDAIWIGLYHGGIARISHGHVTLFEQSDQNKLNFVTNLTQAPDGSLWGLESQQTLIRFGLDDQWHREPSPEPKARINAFLIDSSNTLWVPQAGDHLYRRPLAQSSYIATEVPTSIVFGLTEVRDGSIWMADVIAEKDIGRTQRIDRSGHLLQVMTRASEAYAIHSAPDGTVFIATQSEGLRRITPGDPPSVDAFDTKQGLSADELHAILVDSDGDVWVGGRRGLDRFKQGRLIQFDPHAWAGWEICSDKSGAAWLTNDHVYKVSGGKTTVVSPKGFIAINCAADGDLWLVSGPDGLWHRHAGEMTRVPDVPGVPPWGVNGFLSTSDHTLYASIGASGGRGFWQFKNDRWTKMAHEGTLGESGRVSYIDSHDRLWKGYDAGLVGLPLENRLMKSGTPGLGLVRDIKETTYGIMAAGANGVAINRDDHFQMLAFTDNAEVKGISGFVESRNGDLWLNALRGIVRLGANEIRKGLDQPGYRMKTDLVTQGDFVGAPQGFGSYSTTARDDLGNLWFVTVNGVVHLDPGNWQTPHHLPILSLKAITVNRQPLGIPRVIKPHPDSLELRYLGVNLSAPDQVVYKYRLEGFDADWQEVGHRTEAIYTHLPAGTYTFQVMASNGDGVWSTPLSTEPFRVLPSFYQTIWFTVLCACAALALLWLGFRIRLRAVTREVRARAEERADERIRIARELHDTLLQGVQGLLLTFHVAAQKIPPQDPSRSMLDKALSTADRIIIEGRNRVSQLRMEHLSDAELLPSIENVCNELTGHGATECRVGRTGEAGSLRPHIADEIFYVAREALTNAYRHSEAARITLELGYGKRFFTMRCHDNGRGFAPEEAGNAGHWGLRGMAERVRKLGGTLEIASSPGEGAEILVSIPSFRAYQHASRAMFYLRALF